MTRAQRKWRIELTVDASLDFEEILHWTEAQFGVAQSRAYSKTLVASLRELESGPTLVGVKSRNDIEKGVFALHVARHGRKGRHFIVFRIDKRKGSDAVVVLRILHEARDFGSIGFI